MGDLGVASETALGYRERRRDLDLRGTNGRLIHGSGTGIEASPVARLLAVLRQGAA